MRVPPTPTRTALAVLSLIVLTLPSPAQSTTAIELSYSPINGIDLDSVGHGGVQGRIVHGDPAGDLAGAMFYIVDGEVLWSPVPYALTSVEPIAATGTPAVDLVMMHDSAQSLDLLFMSDANGLSVATLNAGGADFTVIAVPGTSSWANATQLRARVLNSGRVITGLMSDGQTVRVSKITATAETHKFSLTVPVPVLSYDLIDIDGNVSRDIAVVTSAGLTVFNKFGGVLEREMVSVETGGVITFASSDGDRLAFWWEDPTTGDATLRIVDGPSAEADIALATIPPGDTFPVNVLPAFMAKGDYEADGNEDLLLQIHRGFCIVLINQDVANAHFSLATNKHIPIALTGSPGAVVAPGAGQAYFGDIDSSPGDDLIVPLDPDNRVQVRTRSGPLDPFDNSSIPVTPMLTKTLVALESTYYWGGVGSGISHMNLAMNIPSTFMPDGSGGGYEYVHAITWFQDGTNPEFMLRGTENVLYPIATDRGGNTHQWMPITAQNGQQNALPNYYWPDADNMWVLFRFVDASIVGGVPHISGASRFSLGAFTMQTSNAPGATISSYLPGLLDPNETAPVVGLLPTALPLPAETWEDNGGYVGAWVPMDTSLLTSDHAPPELITVSPVPLGIY